MPTAVRSHAKINLGLYIGAPRSDGFHALATVYQTLELHDTVTVNAGPSPATAVPGVGGKRRQKPRRGEYRPDVPVICENPIHT